MGFPQSFVYCFCQCMDPSWAISSSHGFRKIEHRVAPPPLVRHYPYCTPNGDDVPPLHVPRGRTTAWSCRRRVACITRGQRAQKRSMKNRGRLIDGNHPPANLRWSVSTALFFMLTSDIFIVLCPVVIVHFPGDPQCFHAVPPS